MTFNICFKPNAFIRTNQGIVWAMYVLYTRDLSYFIHEKQEYVWPYMQKCSCGTRLNGWMHSKQTGEKQVDKLKGRGIRVVEQLQKTFDWMRLNGWRAEENFWTAFAHSHSFTNKKQTCEWRHNNNSRGQVGKIMKKNCLLLETQSKAKSLTMQIFNLHFVLNFVKVSVLSILRYMYNVAW